MMTRGQDEVSLGAFLVFGDFFAGISLVPKIWNAPSQPRQRSCQV